MNTIIQKNQPSEGSGLAYLSPKQDHLGNVASALFQSFRRLGVLVIFLLCTLQAFSQAPSTSRIISTIGGNGASGFSGAGGLATNASFEPYSLTTDAAGNVYVALVVQNRIVRIDKVSGILTVVAGNGTMGFGGDAGPATNAQLSSPYGVVLDNSNNIYLTDSDNGRIRKVTAGTGIINTIGGGGTATVDGGPATGALLSYPIAIALDASNNIYIADLIDEKIRKINAATGIITTVAGGGTGGDGGLATAARIFSPTAVAVDNAGNIYFAEEWGSLPGSGHRIKKVDAATGILSTLAGTGTAATSPDGITATSASINYVYGIAVDANQNVYLAERNSHKLRILQASDNKIYTIAGNGTGGFSGDGGFAVNAQLNFLTGVAVDSDGTVYVADRDNNRVRKVLAPLSATITASSNVSCFGGSNGSATVTASGGTSPYTYNWSPSGGTNSTASGLSAVSYTVTVTDATSATATATVSITQPATPVSGSTVVTNVSCFGGTNGLINLTPSGGTPPYTYNWGGGNTTEDRTGLAAGSYSVTITDGNACTGSVSATVTQPASAVTASITAQTNVCGSSSNGSATVTASGGTGPYSYAWSPSGGNNATATGLAAGNYTVTVSDNNSCTATATTTITSNPSPTVSVSYPFVCAGGAAILTATGANSYNWSPNNLPLDAASGALMAVGLRRLDASYTGNAIRLRRSSDDAEMDFGFVGNDLDVAAINTWLVGATGYATTLYDQSGNSQHVTQATPANQPSLVISGMNGKPTLHFSSSQYMRNTTNYPSPFTVVYAARQTGPARGRMLSSVSNNWLLGWHAAEMRKAYFEGWVYDPSVAGNSNTYIYTGTSNGSTSQLYENGTLYASNSNGVTGPNGIQLNGSGAWGQLSDGDFSEVLVYGTVLSATSRSAVEANMANYYILAQNQFLGSIGTTYTVTGTDANGCSGSASITPAVTVPGNPNVFGINEWNVYGWNAGNGAGTSGDWTNNYSGYYTATGLNFSTQNHWCTTCSPSNAANYQGCTIGPDNHSWSAKRQGFPCGYYQIDVTGHDDRAELYINGVQVWLHVGCCDSHSNVWSGYLSSTDQVEFRATEGGGGSNGSIVFTTIPFAISGPSTLCAGAASVNLSVPASPAVNYVWSTSETTSTIAVTSPGTYTVTYTDVNNASCTGSTSHTVSGGTTPVFTTCPGNLSFTSCAAVTYAAEASGSPAVTYTYALTGATTGTGTGIGNNATFYVGTTTVTITATNVCGTATCTFDVIIPVGSMPGDPTVFGTGEWLVYGWNAGNGAGTSGDWTNNYSGYYPATGLNFNTQSQWPAGASPSSATGYQGCPIQIDSHSWSAKRKGFPCDYYRIDIPTHDDRVQLYIDGVLVFNHTGCCDSHANVWTGFLTAASEVEFRATDANSNSFGSITFTPVSATVSGDYFLCAGATGTLTAPTATGATYSWSSGQTSQSISVSSGGTYIVTITSPDGQCSVSDTHIVTVPQVPAVSNNGPVCSGNIVNLTASGVVPGGSAVELSSSLSQYVISPNLAAANNTATLEIWFKPNAAGVIVTELGQITPNTGHHDSHIEVLANGQIWVRVWALAPVNIGTVTLGTWNHAVVRYNAATLTLDGVLNGVPSVGSSTGGRSGPSNLYYAVGAADGTNMGSGAYFNGEIDEFRVWTTALSNEEINAWKNREVTSAHTSWANLLAYYKFNGDYTDSKNSNTATPVNSPVFVVPDHYTYTWSGANAPSPSTSEVQTTGVLTSTNDYTVVASANGCSFAPSAPTTVTVLPVPSAQATSNSPICEGGTINLTGTGGTSYTWSGPNGFTSTDQNPVISNATPAMAGSYSITSSNNNGCTASQAIVNVVVNANPVATATNNGPLCAGATLLLSASGGDNYSWSGPGSFSSGQQSPTRTNTTTAMAGLYSVTVTNTTTGCSSSGTTAVTINTLPVVSFSGLLSSYCIGDPNVTLTGSPVGGSFTGTGISGNVFSPAAAGNGTHTIVYSYTDANGCTNTSSQQVSVSQLPVVSISGLNSSYCTNSADVVLTGSPSGGTFTGTGINGNIFSPSSAGNGTFTITYSYTSASGCSNSTSQQVTVNTVPVATASNNGPVCEGSSINLTASGGNGYIWSGPGSFSSNQQNPVLIVASASMAGMYTVTVSNTTTNCSSTATTNVVVNDVPVVSAAANPATITVGSNTTLSVMSTEPFTTYTWTGTDLNSNTGSSVSAAPTIAGTYTYTVTADNGSCTSAAMAVVTVQSGTSPCTTAMNGTYYINPAMATGGTNFQSFAAAVTALQTIGVCAPVVMQISAGTYTAPFVLGAIPGTSATNTVTFEGNGATISGCQGSALVSLTHTKHVTISNLTLAPTCDVIGIRLGGSIENVTLSGNTVNLLSTALSTNKSIGILIDAPTGNVSLLNNTIRNGFVGMWARNTNAPITIEGNKLYNAYAYGILLQNMMADRDPAVANSGVLVNSNRVRMRSTAHPNAQGIRANYIGGGFMMNSNYINRSPLMAINLANANQAGTVRAEVINNRMGGDAPNSSGGIGIYNVDNLNLLHNSIVGETRILLSENLDVRNNSFVSVDASQYAYMGTTVSNSYLQLNNNYYANTATNGNFVGVETLYLNMPQLQQGYQGVVTYNQNSIGGMGYPYTDSLRITDASPLFNAGMMAGVVVDFEGQTRPDGAGVDIGADEYISFTPPRLAAATLSAEVYPNPFHNNLTVKLTAAEAGAVQVVLSDLMGRQIMSRSYTTEAGITDLSVGVKQQLPQGVYLLQVTQGEATSTFRVVKH